MCSCGNNVRPVVCHDRSLWLVLVLGWRIQLLFCRAICEGVGWCQVPLSYLAKTKKVKSGSKAEDTRGRKPTPIFDSKNRRSFTIISPIHYHTETSSRNNELINYLQQFCTIYKQNRTKTVNFNQSNCFCWSRASENWPRNRSRCNRNWFLESEIGVVFAWMSSV